MQSFSCSVEDSYKTIRIGVANLINREEFAKTIIAFQEAYPDIGLELINLGYYDCERYQDNQMTDFCLTAKPDDFRKFNFIRLYKHKMFLFMNKENQLCDKKELSICDIKNEKLILLSSDTKIRTKVMEAFKKKGYSPKVVLSTSHFGLIMEYLNSNKAAAILPEFAIPKMAKRQNRICKVPIKDLPHQVEIGFLLNKNKKLSVNEKIFINFFVSNYKPTTLSCD
jgi:DNA-binding transcriptional LysR family regulator